MDHTEYLDVSAGVHEAIAQTVAAVVKGGDADAAINDGVCEVVGLINQAADAVRSETVRRRDVRLHEVRQQVVSRRWSSYNDEQFLSHLLGSVRRTPSATNLQDEIATIVDGAISDRRNAKWASLAESILWLCVAERQKEVAKYRGHYTLDDAAPIVMATARKVKESAALLMEDDGGVPTEMSEAIRAMDLSLPENNPPTNPANRLQTGDN